MEAHISDVKDLITCYGDYAVWLVTFVDEHGNWWVNKKVWCCHKVLYRGDVLSVMQTDENDYREVSPQGEIL